MLKAKLLGATAGAEAALAIEDVFSTYLYTGNGSTQTINNGIDLAGEGGLVWIKSRSAATDNFLFDTVRGTTKEINSNSTAVEATLANSLTAFNANGFSIGSATGIGVNAATYASWTFRKAPRFFDVVTWVGNGSSTQTIPHGLGAAPGCIIIKDTNFALNWRVYHTSLGTSKHLVLNSTAAEANSSIVTATSGADFTVNSNGTSSGRTHVAYLFAHDPLGPSGDGSDGLIACGSFTGDSLGTRQEIDLGWEPQWLLIKRVDGAGGNWRLYDTMRGWSTAGAWNQLAPNLTDAETAQGTTSEILPNGFTVSFSTSEYIYIAIRRGPMREPTVGTEVFAPYVTTSITPSGSTSNNTTYNVGFPVDFLLQRNKNGTDGTYVFSRLTGQGRLKSETTAAEGTAGAAWWDSMVGAHNYNPDYGTWNFRRAPGFFDVVAYSGSTSNQNIKHNLGVTPELLIIKVRNNTNSWPIYNKDSGVSSVLYLNQTWGNGSTTRWNSTVPTETQFTLKGSESGSNTSGENYIAYLFASLPGISKVGSYTGNGSSQTINCAFTTGARFVLIKRTDTTGDWYVWDTARGIVSGNDPHLSLNTTAAEVTTDDTIDPDNSGFIVNQVAATNVNVSSASYIFYAVS